jgi:hypothetical protein
MPRCQFLQSAQMIRVSIPASYRASMIATTTPRTEDAVCGRPAEWNLTFGDLERIWVCDQHYEVLIGQGWSEA